jgi:PAS domain S-box-containing protein
MPDARPTQAEAVSDFHDPAASLLQSYLGDPLSPRPEEVHRLASELAVRLADLEHQNQELHETQRQLEDYRDRYIDLYDSAPLGYVSLDEEGYIQEINLAGAAWLGKDRDALTGYPFADYVVKDDVPAFLEHVRKCVEQRGEVISELRLLADCGLSRTVQLRSIPVEDAKHELTLCKTAIADITANKQIEDALRHSEEQLRMAVEATALGTWDYDLAAERLTWSHECKAIFGLSADAEVDYQTFLSFVHAEDRPQITHAIQEALAADGTGEYHCQYRVLRPDGQVRWLETNGQAYYRDIEGVRRPVRLVGAVVDITERKRSMEDAEQLASIVESSDDAIIAKTLEGIIVTWNGAAERLYGYSAEEALGKSIAILAPPEQSNEVAQILERLKRGERIARYETVRVRKDGTKLDVSLTISPLMDAERRIWGASTIARDITDRKRAEQALRDSEARHRAILDASVDAIITIDERGTIDSANPATERLFGYSPAELVGGNVSILMPSPHHEMHDTYLDNYRRTGQRKIIGIGREVSGRRKDGSLFPMDLSVSEIVFAGRRMFMGLVHDVTDRKQSEETLRQARDDLEVRVQERTAELTAANRRLQYERHLFDTLMDYVPHGIFFKDAEGRFIRINKAKAHSFGLADVAAAIGKTDLDFCALERALPAIADEREIVQTGRALIDQEEKEIWPDGRTTWVTTTKMPLYDEAGRIVGTFGLSRDITESKRAAEVLRFAKEAAEAANRAKSSFLANMSHEIRTPMNAIIGMTELVLDTPLSPQQREFLMTVEESAESLLAIINDILDFSKIEAERLIIERIPFDIREQLGDTIKTLALRADRKGIELVCHVDPHVPEVVVADSLRLRQVIINLVGNAIKFTEVGEVVVELDHEPLSEEEIRLHFQVTDTGIGIPADKQAAIFEAFEQGDGSISRRYGGTGLGLAISSRLVRLMGGRIWVESEFGRGSRFHFEIPCGLAAEEPLPECCDKPGVLRGAKVLVVDDNATNRLILEETLANWMLQPSSAPGGEESLRILRQTWQEGQPYRLVLIDAHMPKMDGFTLARQIKEDPELGSTVIMMLTSGDQPGDIARCQELGIAVYLIKPVKQSELLDAILLAMGVATAEEEPCPRRPESRPKRQRPLNILLAEDSLVNQTVVTTMLQKEGHAVSVAGNGRAALAAAASQSFDLVLMDVQMPELDGLEATSAIRARERRTGGHVPIVAMTAHALKGDRERCLQAGMDEYLAKPIHARDLLEVIDRALGSAAVAETLSNGPPPDADVVDWNEVFKAVAGDAAGVDQVVNAALEESPRLMAALHVAIASDDRTALRLAAHTLKGSLQYFGAAHLCELAYQLERMGQEGDLKNAPPVLANLENEMARFVHVLAEHK